MDLRATLKGAGRSVTIWFNSVAAIVLASLQPLQDALPQIQDYLPQGFYRWLGCAVVVGNILLRAKTNSSLANKA